MKKVYIDGVNITDYVDVLPQYVEKRTYKDDVIQLPEYNFNVFSGAENGYLLNFDYPTSLLYGRDMQKAKVEIKENNLILWEGKIDNVKVNEGKKIANVTATSVYNRLLDSFVGGEIHYPFTAPDPTLEASVVNYSFVESNITPAKAAEKILKLARMEEYIGLTFGYADTFLNQLDILIDVYFMKESKITVIDALQRLARVSCSDCFVSNNQIHFVPFDPYYTNALNVATITPDDVIEMQKMLYQDQIINDYSIKYGLDAPAITDSEILKLGKASIKKYGKRDLSPMDLSVGQDIVMYSLTGVQNLGSHYVYRNRNPKKRLIMEINRETVGRYIDLLSYINLDGFDWSDTSKQYEVMEIKATNYNTLEIIVDEIEILS